MKLSGTVLLAFLPALLAAGTVAPVSTPPTAAPQAATPAPPPKPAPDYTTQAAEPPMVSEYDPAPAPPPPYAEPPDEDGLRQCVSPDGVPIFTDRRCSDMGATPQVTPPPPSGDASGLPSRARTCARNQGMLLDGVRAALESHDANRLADYYHWTGMDSTQGYRMMERLDAFSSRQVVDVRLVRAAQPDGPPGLYEDRFDPLPLPPQPGADTGASAEPGEPPTDAAAVAAAVAAGAPHPPRRQLASMLRVDQMQGAKDVSANITYFHLLTNAGCWWMRF